MDLVSVLNFHPRPSGGLEDEIGGLSDSYLSIPLMHLVNHFHETGSPSASPKIIRLLWNPKVHYRVHKRPPLVLIPSHMNPFHTFPSYLSRSALIIISHMCVGLPRKPGGKKPLIHLMH
jgi:hypothetical protein